MRPIGVIRYTSSLGWAELLAPFMSVPLDRGDRYNCFYVLMSKYVPYFRVLA